MNTDIVKGNWKEIKGKIKQQWAKFTDDEIAQLKGSYEELEGQIQKKYGWQKEQARTEINNFLRKNNYE
jgi:uncharacterized protein YjbJ (UPF0337 family)